MPVAVDGSRKRRSSSTCRGQVIQSRAARRRVSRADRGVAARSPSRCRSIESRNGAHRLDTGVARRGLQCSPVVPSTAAQTHPASSPTSRIGRQSRRVRGDGARIVAKGPRKGGRAPRRGRLHARGAFGRARAALHRAATASIISRRPQQRVEGLSSSPSKVASSPVDPPPPGAAASARVVPAP